MPELPDIELYLHAMRRRLVGQVLKSISVRSPSLLRSFNPPLEAADDRPVTGLRRLGKRIVWEMKGDLFLVFHLMIAGRFHQRKPDAQARGKYELACFRFADFALMLTERSQQKRASLHLVAGEAGLDEHRRDGIDVRDCSTGQFAERLRSRNRTVKRALTDPSLLSGIGNAYSDEILHAARLSPLRWTSRLADDELARLHTCCQVVLEQWIQRLQEQAGDAFPEKVTAFRPEMAVHGKFGEPCPDCGAPVQRIVYAANECNYCANCQTDGKVLADRSLSRLLKDDWPRQLEDWENE